MSLKEFALSEKIESLPGINWSARAAIASAMEIAEDGDQVLVLIRKKDGSKIFQRGANLNTPEAHWLCSVAAANFMRRFLS